MDIKAKIIDLQQVIADTQKQIDELVKQIPLSFSEEFREKLVNALVENALPCSFGDGLEVDYLRGGTTFVGYDNMTDEELADEYAMYCTYGDEEESEDELLAEARAQLAITKTLTE